MAVPKKKTSRSKTRKRRSANSKLGVPSLSKCSKTGAITLPHRICPSSGYYKNREVLKLDDQ